MTLRELVEAVEAVDLSAFDPKTMGLKPVKEGENVVGEMSEEMKKLVVYRYLRFKAKEDRMNFLAEEQKKALANMDMKKNSILLKEYHEFKFEQNFLGALFGDLVRFRFGFDKSFSLREGWKIIEDKEEPCNCPKCQMVRAMGN